MTTEPFLMHYDGNKWIEVSGDKSQMPDGFTDIYAINKNHFWISSSEYVSEFKSEFGKNISLVKTIMCSQLKALVIVFI